MFNIYNNDETKSKFEKSNKTGGLKSKSTLFALTTPPLSFDKYFQLRIRQISENTAGYILEQPKYKQAVVQRE